MKKFTWVVVSLLTLILPSQAQEVSQIKTQAGAFYPVKNDGKITPNEWDLIPAYQDSKFVMMQFAQLPNEQVYGILAQRQISLITYLPKNTYYCKVPANYNAKRFEDIHALSVFAPNATQKLHTRLQLGDLPPYAVEGNLYKIMISLYTGVKASEIKNELSKHSTIIDIYNEQHITASILPSNLSTLAELPFVQFVDVINAPMQKENLLNRTDHRSNVLNTDYGAGRKYDGNGVRVALTDDGFIGPHIDYQGRTSQDNVLTVNNGNHGDHCGGTIMSAGNLDPNGRGMAPACKLWVYQALSASNYILNDTIFTSPSTSIDLVSTSYSDGCNTGYNAGAESADRQIRMFKNVMRIFSAGNNGTSDCSYGAGTGWGNITGGIKSAKNLIAVANLDYKDELNSSSSRGPATDGRIKPDVSAVGTDVYSTVDPNTYDSFTGTSMSCPGVAGVFTQLYQAYRQLNANVDPNTGLLKNILMNTCDDIGNPGPDFKHGYGRVNALRAVKLLETSQHITDVVANAATKTFTINVPANTQRVKIMLNWLDQEAAVAASTALVNDLDLTVTNPSAVSFLPWVLDHTPVVALLNANAIRAVDHLNNTEQVTIDNPIAGAYTVSVNGFSVPFGPQEFFISYEFILNNQLEVTYPIGGEALKPGDVQTLRWDAIPDGNVFDLAYTTDNGSSWNIIFNGLAQDRTYYDWTVPNISSGNCKFRVTRNGFASTSPANFTILQVPNNLTVASVCPDTITLTWSPVLNATSYEVSMLGALYMDSIGTTVDTFYKVAGLNAADEHWFSVKAKNNSLNAIGRRAFAIQQMPGVSNCILQFDAQADSSSNPGARTLLDCAAFPNLPVQLSITNKGLTPITTINFSYQLNSLPAVTEVYSGNILPNASHSFQFTTPLTGLTTGTNIVKMWATLIGDQYQGNDTIVTPIFVENSAIATLPWFENFESHIVCATTFGCDETTCDLVNNMVNEKNGIIDDFDWKAFAGSTFTSATGPDVDHTLGTGAGKYVYLESSACFEKTGLLLTPCFHLTTAMQPYLTYWYHLYGAEQGSLHVDAFVDSVWQNDITPVVSGNKGNSWKYASVDLSAYLGKTIYFRFRGITGTTSKSDMALDDIGVADSAFTNDVSDIQSSFDLYPNPALGQIEVSNKTNQGLDEICIYNTLGELVKRILPTSSSRISIDITALAEGIYVVAFKEKGELLYRNKFVKIK